jgi:UDP-N-acetylmuramoyl-tripeptide--D-alanyl-D-alanine ligase
MDFVHVATAAEARDALDAILSPGDAVLIKGSNAVGLSALVASLSGRG